ncbi:UbiA prenyltransferase family protein [Tautonia plasticadhaerens]|uniref:Uncharacterized protein n=1 Tax=Tautonia plasticadhaerens TaxID=2527974 RepID=A0A518H8M6_9BACT|nr:hypothetical protein [Tautonia plasticadhaerens]QDV37208.1 hypothetical protein ElP_51410 [Tautonia plasticadhaerens]
MSTAFEFSCPSCAAPGRAKVEWVGRTMRCKHCKATFNLPSPGEAGADSYELAEPAQFAPAAPMEEPPRGGTTTFTRSYRDAPLPDVPRDHPRRKRRQERTPREGLLALKDDRRVRIIGSFALLGVVLAVGTFTVPGFGTIGGWTLTGIGLLMIAVGFSVGAYAAFCEDFLYGFAYVVFPIYTGYYLVTRFDDLWPWFATSTVGFVLFMIGTKALELSLAA